MQKNCVQNDQKNISGRNQKQCLLLKLKFKPLSKQKTKQYKVNPNPQCLYLCFSLFDKTNIQINTFIRKQSDSDQLFVAKRFAIKLLYHLNFQQSSFQQVAALIKQTLILINQSKSYRNKHSTINLIPVLDQSQTRVKFIQCFSLQKGPRINIKSNKKLNIYKLLKLLSVRVKITKKPLQLNKWIFFAFLPQINLSELKNINKIQIKIVIQYSKYGNIQIGLIPTNTILEHSNFCSNQRNSYHMRNGQIFDQNSNGSRGWRENQLTNCCFQSVLEPMKMKIVIRRENALNAKVDKQQSSEDSVDEQSVEAQSENEQSQYVLINQNGKQNRDKNNELQKDKNSNQKLGKQVQTQNQPQKQNQQQVNKNNFVVEWIKEQNNSVLARCRLNKNLYEDGFKLCCGIYHTADSISVGYTSR